MSYQQCQARRYDLCTMGDLTTDTHFMKCSKFGTRSPPCWYDLLRTRSRLECRTVYWFHYLNSENIICPQCQRVSRKYFGDDRPHLVKVWVQWKFTDWESQTPAWILDARLLTVFTVAIVMGLHTIMNCQWFFELSKIKITGICFLCGLEFRIEVKFSGI